MTDLPPAVVALLTDMHDSLADGCSLEYPSCKERRCATMMDYQIAARIGRASAFEEALALVEEHAEFEEPYVVAAIRAAKGTP